MLNLPGRRILRKGKTLLMLCLMLTLLGSCVKRPKGVLSDDKMAAVMADMEIAEAYMETQPLPAEFEAIEARGMHENFSRQELYKESLTASVLKRHKVSRADYDSTVAWYGRNVDAYYKLDTKIQANIAKRRRKLAGKSPSKQVEKEELIATDIWPYGRMAEISDKSGSELMQFSLDGSAVGKGDRLEWRSRLRQDAEIDVLLGVQYDSGAVAFVSKTFNGQKRFEVTLQTDSAQTVNRTFGSLLVRDKVNLPFRIDSISLKSFPFDSTQYSTIYMQKKLNRL